MVWGQSGTRGIEDLVRRLNDNDYRLESLTIMRQRRFNHDDVASLVRAMASNTHLTELYASSHPLAPHTAALMADLLLNSITLKSLCVGDSTLGDDGVVALARGVAGSSLTRLDLGGKGLGVRGAAALSAALASAAVLSHLLLTANTKLGDAGLRALCNGDPDGTKPDAAASSCAAPSLPPPLWAGLRVLELQGCGITAAGISALAASPNCRRLEVLRLDGNPLGAAGGRAVRELLQGATSLRELYLRATELGDEGGEVVAASLAPCAGGAEDGASAARLSLLDLSECGLGPRTAGAFSKAFQAAARLATLNLAGNQHIRDADAAALAQSLAASSNDPLAHLDLSGTQAGPSAVAALSKVPGLRHLSLVGCSLGSEGAGALATSLAEGGWIGLRELCISGTGIGKEAMADIFGRLAAGGAPNLQGVELGANPATQDDDFPDLLEKLRTCRPGVAVYWRSGDDPAPVVK